MLSEGVLMSMPSLLYLQIKRENVWKMLNLNLLMIITNGAIEGLPKMQGPANSRYPIVCRANIRQPSPRKVTMLLSFELKLTACQPKITKTGR